ncbi:dynein light chain Tctex-type 3-like [Monodelphis domestica]|uniref:dynein light chain Tctex-type 3-like n=1 Tax=Monodelphis domestica TaxID=13616 RepID=UPI0007B41BB8|nr:dynein light chain Tctex-type 3-like [Monodelphis domestica]
MEVYQPHNDEIDFSADEAHNIVKECIDAILGGIYFNFYNSVMEQSLTHLIKLGKTYKYIVTCPVIQKSRSGLHIANSCFGDTTSDGIYTIR